MKKMKKEKQVDVQIVEVRITLETRATLNKNQVAQLVWERTRIELHEDYDMLLVELDTRDPIDGLKKYKYIGTGEKPCLLPNQR